MKPKKSTSPVSTKAPVPLTMTPEEVVAYLEHLHILVNANANMVYGAGWSLSPAAFVVGHRAVRTET